MEKKLKKLKINKHSFFVFIFLIPFFYIYAAELESENFIIKDSSFENFGEMTSTNFSLMGVLDQFSIGSSTANTFKLNSGFLYFPKVTSPVLSAVAGDEEVSLSWTPSVGFLGTNINGYLLGQSSVSGGPYTFASVGNITNATRSSLTNNQTYYFIIQSQDALGDIVAHSGEVSVTPVASSQPTGRGGSSGGNSGDTFISSEETQITIKGLAYPFAHMVILKDAVFGKEVVADSMGNFEATFKVSVGIYSFGIYAIDKDGFKSPTFGFSVNSRFGQTVTTSDIVVAPTIGADKSVVKFGNNIQFFGYAYPISSINIMVNSEKEILDQTKTDKYGRWFYTLDSSELEIGEHTAKSQTLAEQNLVSAYSAPVGFQVGSSDIYINNEYLKDSTCNSHGDINKDAKINLIDFSILMYFWNMNNPQNPCTDINMDGKVNLQDFSIMLYWWTGK